MFNFLQNNIVSGYNLLFNINMTTTQEDGAELNRTEPNRTEQNSTQLTPPQPNPTHATPYHATSPRPN